LSCEFVIFEHQTEIMIVKRIDSATILVGKVMFSLSETDGQYYTSSQEVNRSHHLILDEFLIDEKEEVAPKRFTESLRGLIIWLN
jgi:hypothetical protein